MHCLKTAEPEHSNHLSNDGTVWSRFAIALDELLEWTPYNYADGSSLYTRPLSDYVFPELPPHLIPLPERDSELITVNDFHSSDNDPDSSCLSVKYPRDFASKKDECISRKEKKYVVGPKQLFHLSLHAVNVHGDNQMSGGDHFSIWLENEASMYPGTFQDHLNGTYSFFFFSPPVSGTYQLNILQIHQHFQSAVLQETRAWTEALFFDVTVVVENGEEEELILWNARCRGLDYPGRWLNREKMCSNSVTGVDPNIQEKVCTIHSIRDGNTNTSWHWVPYSCTYWFIPQNGIPPCHGIAKTMTFIGDSTTRFVRGEFFNTYLNTHSDAEGGNVAMREYNDKEHGVKMGYSFQHLWGGEPEVRYLRPLDSELATQLDTWTNEVEVMIIGEPLFGFVCNIDWHLFGGRDSFFGKMMTFVATRIELGKTVVLRGPTSHAGLEHCAGVGRLVNYHQAMLEFVKKVRERLTEEENHNLIFWDAFNSAHSYYQNTAVRRTNRVDCHVQLEYHSLYSQHLLNHMCEEVK